MKTLTGWFFHHRYLTVLTWLLALVLLAGGSAGLGGSKYADVFSLPSTDSTKAQDLLQSSFPAAAGDQDSVVWKVSSGTVNDPAVQQRIGAALTKISTLPHVAGVSSPYVAGGGGQISTDGKIAYASVNFDAAAPDLLAGDVNAVVDTAQAAARSGLEVEVGGQAVKQANQKPGGYSEVIGVVAAAIVLFLAFGSLLSMAIPLLTAVAAIGAGLETVILLSHALDISTIAPTLSALIGLGVGIDYALFIVTRYRNGLKSGLEPEQAAATAMDTSGRAVLFAGTTVCIALLGMLLLGISFLSGIGIAASITVIWTVLAATSLLPALLGILGMRVLSRKERRLLAEQGPIDVHAASRWSAWASVVQNRPRMLAGLALIVMLVLAVPTLSLRLGSSDSGNDPASSTTRKAYDLLADGFGPGFNGPLLIVAQSTDPAAAGSTAATQPAPSGAAGTGRAGAGGGAAPASPLQQALLKTPGIASVTQVPLKTTALQVLTVYPTTSPQSAATTDLIDHLRTDVLPPLEKQTRARIYVGGNTATFADFAHVLTGKLPLFIGVIVGLGALLLMVAFRSILVPLTAAVMNLIAAAASFGVVVAVFQWGWGSDLIGLGRGGPIEAFLPVMMLAILFGLSMDYQVFLVSRMHEEWLHTGDNHRAVRVGQAETGKVVTAAATIMICVFVAFVLLGQRVIGEFGIGLAAAVALDAFILRTVLVPAMMHQFGAANWWLPGWLDRFLPHLSVEGPSTPDTSGSHPAIDTREPASLG